MKKVMIILVMFLALACQKETDFDVLPTKNIEIASWDMSKDYTVVINTEIPKRNIMKCECYIMEDVVNYEINPKLAKFNGIVYVLDGKIKLTHVSDEYKNGKFNNINQNRGFIYITYY